jgi:hypothetical protein
MGVEHRTRGSVVAVAGSVAPSLSYTRMKFIADAASFFLSALRV